VTLTSASSNIESRVLITKDALCYKDAAYGQTDR